MSAPPVGATIISGFLGAGKTTLLNGLIAHVGGEGLAILVNDFGDIDIDGQIVEGVDDDVIALANGCICCTMRNDVVQGVLRLVERTPQPKHILVETSGVSDPGSVAQTFLELQRQGLVRLDAILCVVDATAFDQDDPEVGQLARCQVLAADLVVLSKSDLVDAERRGVVEAQVRAIAPWARIIEAEAGRAPFDVLLSLETSSPVRALDEASPRYQAAQAHLHLSSLSVTSAAPFVFAELSAALHALPPEVYRVKGLVALVERPGDRLLIEVAGRRVYIRTVGRAEPGEPSVLVVIGRSGLAGAAIESALLACAVGAPKT